MISTLPPPGPCRKVLKNVVSDDCVNHLLFYMAFFSLDLNLGYRWSGFLRSDYQRSTVGYYCIRKLHNTFTAAKICECHLGAKRFVVPKFTLHKICVNLRSYNKSGQTPSFPF